jgi:hypothetical protein
MIKINNFQLTPSTYYKIVVRLHLQKTWWLYALCFLFSIKYLLTGDRSSFAIFVIIFGMVYLPAVLTYYYFWATSVKNKILFLDRQVTIENDKMIITSDGIFNELPFKHIQKTIETKDYLLLYIAKTQFIYLPKFAFDKSTDIEEFKKIIKNEAF